jgi:PncC family amidohydrolase
MSIAQQAQRILERAKARGLTIVTAESCTAGAVATSLSKASGAAEHFQGGFVTYTKEMKSSVLGVPLKLLEQKGAVCEEVVEAMALGALKLAPADIAVAVTGVAGPEPDEDGNPVGLVFCSAAGPARKVVTVRHFFEGLSREATIQASVEETLTLLEQDRMQRTTKNTHDQLHQAAHVGGQGLRLRGCRNAARKSGQARV